MNKKILILFLFFILSMTSCGKNDQKTETSENVISAYYLNKGETKVVEESYAVHSIHVEDQLTELIGVLSQPSENVEVKAPIMGDVKIIDYEISNGQVVIRFEESYKKIQPTTEILTRAAIVRTLTQIEGIEYVTMQVRDKPLTDVSGMPVGTMKAEMFIDNAGAEINTYEKVKLRLYFATEEGDKLKEISRNVVYNSNISMEKLVVEELIKGNLDSEAFPVINPETKIISVSVKDGVCYVNLDARFLETKLKVTPEVTVYAITNSLIELPNVNKVQLAVEGKTELKFGEAISLQAPLERNLELTVTSNTDENKE